MSPSEHCVPNFKTRVSLTLLTTPPTAPFSTPSSTDLPLLYTYRRCPYAIRARMALLVAKHDFNAYEIVLRDKPAAMLALSPKATVPVLQLTDGQVLDESWDIMAWAWSADDAGGWWRRAQSSENLDLLQRNDGEFKRLLDSYKYPERHGLEGVNRNAPRDEAVATFLVSLEGRLQSQPHLGGATPCATDLAIFPFVRQFSAVEPRWFEAQELPALRAWLAAWVGSALFEACMVKVTPNSVFRFGLAPRLLSESIL
jgi:glutathione S-transferase